MRNVCYLGVITQKQRSRTNVRFHSPQLSIQSPTLAYRMSKQSDAFTRLKSQRSAIKNNRRKLDKHTKFVSFLSFSSARILKGQTHLSSDLWIQAHEVYGRKLCCSQCRFTQFSIETFYHRKQLTDY